MKLLPLVTASAVGSVIAAATIAPAYANEPEAGAYIRVSAGEGVEVRKAEDEPLEDTAEPDATARVEGVTNDEVETDTVTPAPELVAPQNFTQQTEAPIELETIVPDEPAEQTPVEESVELFSVAPAEEAPVEAAAVPHTDSEAETVMPLSHSAAAGTSTPSSQHSTAETSTPAEQNTAAQQVSAQEQLPVAPASPPPDPESALETENRPQVGAGAEVDAVSPEQGRALAAPEGQQDLPPEPREVSTLEPSDKGEENNSSGREDKATKDEDPKNIEGKEQRIESAQSPDKGPLPQTGVTSVALALGGVLILTVGVVLVSRRPRASESTFSLRRTEQD